MAMRYMVFRNAIRQRREGEMGRAKPEIRTLDYNPLII